MFNFRGLLWAITGNKSSLRRSGVGNFRLPLNRFNALVVALLVSASSLMLIPSSNAVIGCPTGSSFSTANPTQCIPDVQRIPRNVTTSTLQTGCPNNYTQYTNYNPLNGSVGSTLCQSNTTTYTGIYTPTTYCDSGDTLVNGICQKPSYQVSGYTYSATQGSYNTGAYSCPNGGSLVMTLNPYCQFSGGQYSATSTAYCSSGTLQGTDIITCYHAPYYNPLSGQGSGAYYTAPSYNYSCPSGGSLSGSTCYTTAQPSYSATNGLAYNYSCPNGGTLSGYTCLVGAYTVTGSTYNPYTTPAWTCNSGDTYNSGLTTNNCTTTATYISASNSYIGICPTHYTMELATGDCLATLFSPVEVFGEQQIWTCTTTQNGVVNDVSISTSDDSFSLNTITKSCVIGTNQYGITTNTDKGYYMCQTVVNNGQIYSFTSTANLSGKSSDSVTYCFYTGDINSASTPDSIHLTDSGTGTNCAEINDFALWLACQYANI